MGKHYILLINEYTDPLKGDIILPYNGGLGFPPSRLPLRVSLCKDFKGSVNLNP